MHIVIQKCFLLSFKIKGIENGTKFKINKENANEMYL